MWNYLTGSLKSNICAIVLPDVVVVPDVEGKQKSGVSTMYLVEVFACKNQHSPGSTTCFPFLCLY